MTWVDHAELPSHYSVLEYIRGKCEAEGYEVRPLRQADDGSGSIAVSKDGNATALPYSYLPQSVDVIERLCRTVLKTGAPKRWK